MARIGLVRPSRALVLRLWILTPRAALFIALLSTTNHSEVGCLRRFRMIHWKQSCLKTDPILLFLTVVLLRWGSSTVRRLAPPDSAQTGTWLRRPATSHFPTNWTRFVNTTPSVGIYSAFCDAKCHRLGFPQCVVVNLFDPFRGTSRCFRRSSS